MWRWTLQSPTGANLSTLPGAFNRDISRGRNTTDEATFSVDLEHPDATIINDAIAAGGGGLPILRAVRDEAQADGTIATPCRFAGILLPLDEGDQGDDDKVLKVTARGGFEWLEGRFTSALRAFDLTELGLIAQTLIAEAELDGPTGLVFGSTDFTVAVDQTFERKRVSDAVAELADTDPGFDFEVIPLDESNGGKIGRVMIYARQGSDRSSSVKFGLGPGTLGNVESAGRQTTRPVNRFIMYGAEGIEGYAESIASQVRWGLWGDADSMSDEFNIDVLNRAAQARLAPEPVRVVSFSPDPYSDACPIPVLDYGIGDTVQLDVRDGAFVYSGQPRVDSIKVTIDDDGYESSHEVGIDQGTSAAR